MDLNEENVENVDNPALIPADFFNDKVFSEETDFEKLINSPEFQTITKFTIEEKPINIMLILLKFCVSNVLTFSATSSLLKLVNKLLGKPVLPDSPHFINRYFNPKNKTEYHGICSNKECLGYLGEIKDFNVRRQCPTCGEKQKLSKTSYKNFFTVIDPAASIQKLINRFDEYYDDIMEGKVGCPGIIQDIYDGAKYMEFVSNLPHSEKK